jgi:carotenoid cleavage dioxygenase-like enzyme
VSNPYLEGNFAPVPDECTATDLPVTGTIPAELDGRYLRNGPNPIGEQDPAAYHWFTGDGMVHGIRLRDGKADWYRNRWVRSSSVAEALGEPSHPGPVSEAGDFASNTNILRMGHRLLACVEAGSRPYELTDDLDTLGPSDLGGTLPGAFTAHPHHDPVADEWHAMAYWWGWGEQVQHLVLGADGDVTHSRMIDTTGGPMVHDLALSERWAVVYDLPCDFDLDAAMAGERLPYHWRPDEPARFGLIPRRDLDGDVVWVDIDPCYVFHTLNAYDDGDTLVVDAVRWDRMFEGAGNGPIESGTPALWRWTIDTAAGTASTEQLRDLDEEFPRIDERLTGRRHRYGYGALNLTGTETEGRGGVVKHDLDRGTSEVLDLGVGSGPNEFVFVPRDGATGEDEGWLVGLAYVADRDRSDLVIVAADDIGAGPVARVHLPRRVPFGFHGNWIPTVGRALRLDAFGDRSESARPTG